MSVPPAMRKIVFVLVCLAHAGYGRRVQTSSGRSQQSQLVQESRRKAASIAPRSQPFANTSHLVQEFAEFLLSQPLPSAFNPAGPRFPVASRHKTLGPRVSQLSMSDEPTDDAPEPIERSSAELTDSETGEPEGIQAAQEAAEGGEEETDSAPITSDSELQASATGDENTGDDASEEDFDVPKVVFVLGGPGAGKSEQCQRIEKHFADWAHIPTGEIKRDERENMLPSWRENALFEGASDELIKSCITFPDSVVVDLLFEAMYQKMQDKGKSFFLLDNFPKHADANATWNEMVSSEDAEVVGVLLFQAPDHIRERRVLDRPERFPGEHAYKNLNRRFTNFWSGTIPLVDSFKETTRVYTIDSSAELDEVWKTTQKVMETLINEINISQSAS